MAIAIAHAIIIKKKVKQLANMKFNNWYGVSKQIRDMLYKHTTNMYSEFNKINNNSNNN